MRRLVIRFSSSSFLSLSLSLTHTHTNSLFSSPLLPLLVEGATPKFLTEVVKIGTENNSESLPEALKIPGLFFAVMSLGSSFLCASLLAPERNRSPKIWGIKGFFGGPLTIRQLRDLDALITRAEKEAADDANRQATE